MYSDFQAGDAYVSKYSGSAVGIILIDLNDPGHPTLSACSGINSTDDFELIPVEEAGERGTNEIVQGRVATSGTLNYYWTPQRGDALQTRDDFIGREYTILEVIGDGRPNEGTILRAFTGAKLGRVSAAHGARGPKTGDISFQCVQMYSGAEWAKFTGT